MESAGFQEIATEHGTMSAYVSYPARVKPHQTIIVLQEAFGVNAHILDICHRLNQVGYLTIAPELYHRFAHHLTVPYGERKSIMPLLEHTTNEQLRIDAQAAVDFARKKFGLPVSVIGFCMGGFAAVVAALHADIRTAISFYGAGLLAPRSGVGYGAITSELPQLRCPLLLIYGEDDPSITFKERHRLSTIFQEHHKIYEVEVFTGCNHGFFCDERKSYEPVAAQAAWEHSLRWLKTYA